VGALAVESVDGQIAMPAPHAVLTLVENFERNLDAYRNGQYNETQVRRDFIDPMFKALGWDMDNSAGYAEAYRDVIHEDATNCIHGLQEHRRARLSRRQ
jgi:hypothetical protein